MARERAPSMTDGVRAPHCISLKVLRLSRPGFYSQFPIPVKSNDNGIIRQKGLPYPSVDPDDPFILTPLLMLPPSFGPAYVGESFSCTLAANNDSMSTTIVVKNILIVAEMQTPSQKLRLVLEGAGGTTTESGEGGQLLESAKSLQRIVRHDLKEEGPHVLAVTVTYKEVLADEERQRSFRKLYQFSAQQLLVVRTKMGEIPAPAGIKGRKTFMRILLEAQLENMGESPISLTMVTLSPKIPFKSTSLNWDAPLPAELSALKPPMLQPRDVTQVAFLVEQEDASVEFEKELERERRAVLGQLNIEWCGQMGERGSLSTGWLATKRR